METVGPDVKRPRLNYDGPTRMASQQHAPLPSPAHPNPSILPAPSSTYAPSHHQQQSPQPPPSPFGHEIPHDPRAPVEPSVHSFVQHNSGHTTPRDGRFPHELSYSRRGSASAAPRSPDDHHFQPPRPLSVAVPNDTTQYPNQQYSTGPTDHLVGYQPPDPHMNGAMTHGIPIHPHGEGAPMAPTQYADYGPPMHPGPGYAAMPYGGAGPQAQMRGKKGNRAQQVYHAVCKHSSCTGLMKDRLVIFVEPEKPSVTKADHAVVSVWKTTCSVIIKTWLLQSMLFIEFPLNRMRSCLLTL